MDKWTAYSFLHFLMNKEESCRKKGENMFKVIKLTTIVYVVCAVVLVAAIVPAFVMAGESTEAFSQGEKKVIVIDAGHGGADPGVTGVTSGIKESELNLKMALILGELFTSVGYRAVQTRTTDGSTAEGAFDKSEDMRARKEVIERAKPCLVISLHMNRYEEASRRGVQVFYSTEGSAALAESLQKHLNEQMNIPTLGRGFEAIRGEYFIAQCTEAPSVIIECAFLSSPLDEALITDAGYRLRLAGEIEKGVTAYLNAA